MLTTEPRLGSATTAQKRGGRVPARPGAELALDNMKQRRDTTTLFLGDRGIEKLDPAQLSTFANLAVLWLNDNKLTKLKGLDANFRLTELYLQNNRLASISNPSCSLPELRFLETLLLQNNAITDLVATLGTLERLPRLRILNLFGNPVAEEANYRPTTVHRLRALEIFDQHVVSYAEREKAGKLFATQRIHRRFAFGGPVAPWDKTPVQKRFSLSLTERWLEEGNARVRSRRAADAERAEHEAELQAHMPAFELAFANRGRAGGATTERVSAAPKGHTPCIVASFGLMRVHDPLVRMARASGAAHVFVRCALWGIPAEPLRTKAADLKALAAGEVDWRLEQIATAGREAEAYAVLLQKAYARGAARAKLFHVPVHVFGMDDDGVDSKHHLAHGYVDLTELFDGENEDGRLTQTVTLHAREKGAPVAAELDVAFDVGWSPYSALPQRPSLARRTAPDERAAGLTGDLTRDALAYLTAEQARRETAARAAAEAAPVDEYGADDGGAQQAPLRVGVLRDATGEALRQLGCRANDDDVRALTDGLPAELPARELAAALGGRKGSLYRRAAEDLRVHMEKAGPGEPVPPEVHATAHRALRLNQDVDGPPPPPPARIRHRTATSHDLLATVTYTTVADVERKEGKFLPLVNLPRGSIKLDEDRFRKYELRKKQGLLADARPVVLAMSAQSRLAMTSQ